MRVLYRKQKRKKKKNRIKCQERVQVRVQGCVEYKREKANFVRSRTVKNKNYNDSSANHKI